MPTNQEIAEKLREVYNLMQLAGENRFRAIAFDRAAQTIEGLSVPALQYVENRNLTDLKGIGKSIAEDIYSYVEKGTMPVLEHLREQVPDGLMEWLNISGLGPKNIVKIYRELGITEMDELKQACKDGRVAGLSGLGEKSAAKIIKSIEWLEQFDERCLLSEAIEIAGAMKGYLEQLKGVQQIEVAGSLRRRNETIGDIDILVGADEQDAAGIFDAFVDHDLVVEVLGRGETKSSIRTEAGRQVDLRIVRPEQFPAALMYFTGSKEHNVGMRQRARARKLSLNEYGLFQLTEDGETDFGKPVDYSSEIDIYQKLNLHYILPELRENWGELDYFEKHESMPLVEESDIQGVIHAHSTWSDGKYTIEQMARASAEKGYTYLGISDHSRSAAYAGGLTIDEVKHQWDEIDRLNEALTAEGVEMTIFKGIESDILSDGSLDYPDEILDGFDFVIVSVHSGLDMPLDSMMERFMRAIEHPATRMIGHPTGRLLLRRDGSKLDMNRLIDWAVRHDTIIEINANPWRLDLDWRHGAKARETGLFTSINPDAHTIDGIDDIRYGVMIARKAQFDKKRVLNALSAGDFKKWVDRTM
jgi:DNA polymerase (family X)